VSLSALFHQMPPQMRPRYVQLDSACRAIRGNHKRLSSTSRMSVGQIAFHYREYLNSANPDSATAARQRQPPQIGCLPEGRAPKDRDVPSPHPGWVIAQGLLQILSATTPKLVWRFFGARIRSVRPGLAPSEQVVAVALRNTLPEFLATAAKTSILVKFIRGRLDLSGNEGISLTARAARTHIPVPSR
jgi:hypothetical protein